MARLLSLGPLTRPTEILVGWAVRFFFFRKIRDAGERKQDKIRFRCARGWIAQRLMRRSRVARLRVGRVRCCMCRGCSMVGGCAGVCALARVVAGRQGHRRGLPGAVHHDLQQDLSNRARLAHRVRKLADRDAGVTTVLPPDSHPWPGSPGPLHPTWPVEALDRASVGQHRVVLVLVGCQAGTLGGVSCAIWRRM